MAEKANPKAAQTTDQQVAPQPAEKTQVALNEERILKYWQDNNIFEKTLQKTEGGKEFVFYDGPPFATGLPHYGHLIPGTMKDMIPRYKTMRGFHVKRQWGWDCHGLPVENLIEKELGLKNKKEIEDYGVENFNRAARNSVLRYADDWKRIIPRTGRFINMDKAYKTMDSSYTESVWWAFDELYKKGLAYEGFKIMPYCPRCGTTLSNFEVNQGYKDITDISIYAKFKVKGQENVFLIAWTTTPWTLPGNVALAVNPNINYSYVQVDGTTVIVSSELLPKLISKKIIAEGSAAQKEVKGNELVGMSYEPVFSYYTGQSLTNKENAWKVYGADFVTTEDGTGVVHIAPAFGGDDYELALKEKLPVLIHVNAEGNFKDEVIDFKGQAVKPKEDHQKGDVEIIKNLAHRGLLFAKEKITHAYPHCWRCDTPLLNYASSSWFVKVTEIKDKLIAENTKVNWVPDHVKEGRFGKWLAGARDWAISRSRYWGAPMPVWKCKECDAVKTIGSLEELKKLSATPSRNRFFAVRHGEAENNVRNVINSDLNKNTFGISEKGRAQVKETAMKLKDDKIDLILASPFLRTQQTAEIIRETIGLSKDKVITDNRLVEINAGELDGKSITDYHDYFLAKPDRFADAPKGGENYLDVKKRMTAFIYEIEKKYEGKHILFVSHDTPIWLLTAGTMGLTAEQALELRGTTRFFVENATVKEIKLAQLPLNENFELDLHRPYIDGVTFACSCGKGKMVRIPEVFDTWFDSGSMPFAQHNYPFSDKKKFNPKGGMLQKSVAFPADFIAEGLDQTRGWFYTLLVLSTALFDKAPYKNVVVNGLLLAEDGRKMSKRFNNYPELSVILNKYGADALRYFLMSSPLVHAEDVNFSEKGVDEIYKKFILRLGNVVSFYEMFAGGAVENRGTSSNVLDRWIVSRLNQVIKDSTGALEKYELDRAVWPFESFIDDLSTWYLRRSRDRFKGEDIKDKEQALSTLKFVLIEFAKVIAPAMPFVADDIYQKMTKGDKGAQESVHLETWPKGGKVDEQLILEMKEVRDVVSVALEARSKAGIKVRQPLAKVSIKKEVKGEMFDLIKDEVNVKEVVVDKNLVSTVILDTTISESLQLEGEYRELLRAVQELRKKKNLMPSDRVKATIETSEAGKKLISTFENELKRVAGISELSFVNVSAGEEIKTDTLFFKIELVK